MGDIAKVHKFDILSSVSNLDSFIGLSYEAQCLYTHLVLNSDSDMTVWKANALSRMLFGDDYDIDSDKPLKSLIDAGFVSELYDDFGNYGYEIIQR